MIPLVQSGNSFVYYDISDIASVLPPGFINIRLIIIIAAT